MIISVLMKRASLELKETVDKVSSLEMNLSAARQVLKTWIPGLVSIKLLHRRLKLGIVQKFEGAVPNVEGDRIDGYLSFSLEVVILLEQRLKHLNIQDVSGNDGGNRSSTHVGNSNVVSKSSNETSASFDSAMANTFVHGIKKFNIKDNVENKNDCDEPSGVVEIKTGRVWDLRTGVTITINFSTPRRLEPPPPSATSSSEFAKGRIRLNPCQGALRSGFAKLPQAHRRRGGPQLALESGALALPRGKDIGLFVLVFGL
ncbi:hypothetical protein Droror1_Dr00019987 [Drosera rotundifolia]